MMKTSNILKKILFIGAMSVLAFSCTPKTKEPPPPPEQSWKELSTEEQNSMAMVEYEKILEKVIGHDKLNMLPELEAGYKGVITRYPKAFLAEESYWRLIEMNLIYYEPPRLDEAERVRSEFMIKYPQSKMLRIIDDTIVRFYHRRQYWNRLLNISAYYVRNYIQNGTLDSPLFMFYYAEAKFHLKDFVEAEKAYKIVIRLFPGSHESNIAKDQIREINMSKRITDG